MASTPLLGGSNGNRLPGQFSYKLNPQTVLYAGYGDTRTDTIPGIHTGDPVRTDRFFFLKPGYAWLL